MCASDDGGIGNVHSDCPVRNSRGCGLLSDFGQGFSSRRWHSREPPLFRLTKIDRSNIRKISGAWIIHIVDGQPTGNMAGTPVVANGVICLGRVAETSWRSMSQKVLSSSEPRLEQRRVRRPVLVAYPSNKILR
jgi:hypothetical protein